MTFSDIKGQERAVEFLNGSLASGRTSHAYIFYGPQGVGKRSAAMLFAKALNCLSSAERPCNACPSCNKIDSSSHPDISVLKTREGTSSIKIDDIRALTRDIGLKPYEAKKKVYVIDGANALTYEAANALLKTLEEPPTDSVLILIVEKISMVLPTIVSRSQVVKFFSLPTGLISRILTEDRGIEGTKAHILASLSSGSVSRALKFNEGKFFEKRSRMIEAIAGGAFFDWDFDKIPKEELKWYLGIMLTWYRDILVAKARGGFAPEAINIDKKNLILKKAEKIGFDKLETIIRQIISTGVFLEQNANPKLAMAGLGLAIEIN